MTAVDRTRERIRWRCRRGLLELDLLLKAFVEQHLDRLDDAALDAFAHLLTKPDPELLDLAMGRCESGNPHEQRLLALLRDESCKPLQSTHA
jgi:antitoxin CptB